MKMRNFAPHVVGAGVAAYFWQGSVSFAFMVFFVTMALATEGY